MKLRAKTKKQKKKLLKRILKCWKKSPDLRLGQLITLCADDIDVFYIEDLILVKNIESIIGNR